MAKRLSGNLKVWINYTGHSDDLGRYEYRGFIHAPGKGNWHFDGVFVTPVGAPDSDASYDRAAEAAIDYGGFYCTGNRDGVVPDWAPAEALADAIHDGHDYTPPAEDRPTARIPGVYLGELVTLFRDADTQQHFWAEVDRRVRARRSLRPQLRVIEGGARAAV